MNPSQRLRATRIRIGHAGYFKRRILRSKQWWRFNPRVA
jgi:hypothetical protein